MEVLFTERILEIYHNNVRIATHFRCRRKNGYTTQKDHIPESHKWQDNWNPEKLTAWAESKGESVAAVIETVLSSRQHPEQSYRTCMGILSLSKTYGDIRLDKACKCALDYENCSYKMIKNILNNNMDLMNAESPDLTSTLPEHENIRGNQYYMEGLQ